MKRLYLNTKCKNLLIFLIYYLLIFIIFIFINIFFIFVYFLLIFVFIFLFLKKNRTTFEQKELFPKLSFTEQLVVFFSDCLMIFHKENQKKVSIIDKIDWYSYEKKKEMEISDYSEISITVLNPRNNVFHLFQFKDEETKNSWLNKLTEVCKHCIEHRKKFLHRMRRKTKTFSLEMMKLVNFKITMTVKEFFLSIFFNFFIFLFFYFLFILFNFIYFYF